MQKCLTSMNTMRQEDSWKAVPLELIFCCAGLYTNWVYIRGYCYEDDFF